MGRRYVIRNYDDVKINLRTDEGYAIFELRELFKDELLVIKNEVDKILYSSFGINTK